MTRVSTLSQNQFILQRTLTTQGRIDDMRRQTATGFKSEVFADLGAQSLSLTAAQNRVNRATQFQDNNSQTKSKLDLREVAVRQIAEIAKNLKAEFIQAEGVEDSRQLKLYAENQLERLVGILNSRDGNGNYMFGGSRTNVAPVTMTANGAPPPAFTFAFNNDQVVEQARIDDGLTIDIGVLAGADATTPSADFADLFEVLNYFAAGNYPPPVAGTPPMPTPGVPPVAGAASQVITKIDQSLGAVNQLNADLGVKMNLVDEAGVRLQEEIDLTTAFIGSINDANLPQLVTMITQEQVSLEASYRLTAELRSLTLVNFL